MNLLTLIVVLGIWLQLGASSTVALYAVVVLMGVGSGSFVSLGVGCINVLCTPETIGTWFGSVYGVVSFATPPISAFVLERHGPNGLVVFLAAVLLSGMITAGWLKWRLRDCRWAKRTAQVRSNS
ncbi:hypothetical protein VTJ04DRAFT_2900 [Mycothermus thermophilus]|uniref:uncharacterized protein n=1 Tax=Humicola insolens TaxID=85995 RepID=UPI003743BDC8